MRFEKEFIDDLLSSVSMVDLMKSNGIHVKDGAGKNASYISEWCCGKTDYDNGRIDKNKNTYKCMACGEQGNQIHFMRNVQGMNFYQAVNYLCDFGGISIPEEDPAKKEKESRKQIALMLAAKFFQENSHEYLLTRGISEEVLKGSRAGYAPGGRKLREYLEKEGFTKEELREFSLINHKGLDTFFYRAVVPIFLHGKVIDFYGRAVNEKAKENHFYLYGDPFLNGIDDIDPKKIVSLFETAIDRLVAKSHGLDNGVDPGGAHKFTSYHARLLKKKGVKNVYIIFDGDKAGQEGSLEAGLLLTKEDINVRVVVLPEENDPADILQNKGSEAFSLYTKKSKDFLTFKAFHEFSKYPIEIVQKFLDEQTNLKG